MVVGTDAGGLVMFFVGDKTFATRTIPTFVSRGVDMRGEFLPDKLATSAVVGVGSADKIGRSDVELFDELAEFVGVFFDVSFDGDVERLGLVEDFVAVLVGAGLKTNRLAEGDMIAIKNVS